MLFFFNDTATSEIYTLSLHDALPICGVDVPETGMNRIVACASDDAGFVTVTVVRMSWNGSWTRPATGRKRSRAATARRIGSNGIMDPHVILSRGDGEGSQNARQFASGDPSSSFG